MRLIRTVLQAVIPREGVESLEHPSEFPQHSPRVIPREGVESDELLIRVE
jgi:hypothetical protein